MALGPLPTLMAAPAVLVAVVIGVTVFDPSLTTYAFWPLGVMAMPPGLSPTGIAAAARPVMVLIGVTESEPRLTTYANLPLGVVAISRGSLPTPVAGPGLPVVVLIGVTEPVVPDPTLTMYAVTGFASAVVVAPATNGVAVFPAARAQVPNAATGSDVLLNRACRHAPIASMASSGTARAVSTTITVTTCAQRRPSAGRLAGRALHRLPEPVAQPLHPRLEHKGALDGWCLSPRGAASAS